MNKKLLFSLLAIIIAFVANTANAQTYSYIDEDGTPATTSSATEIDDDSPITSPLADGWYYVSSETDFTGDLEISGDVKLILAAHASLTIDGSIQILADASLTIYGTTEDLIDQATLSADDIKGDGTLTINSCLKVNTDDIGSDAAIISILGGQVTAENIKAANLTLGYKSMDDQIVCNSISANDITIAEGCSYKLAGNTYSGTLTSSDITNFCTDVATNRGLEKTSVTFEDENFSYTIWDDGTVAVSGFASGATAPKNLTIPSSVEYNGTSYAVTIIGNNAFQYNNDIHTVIIPSSVVEIGVWAFGNGTLETVEVQGSSLKKIGEYAFYYTQLKEITLPSSIQSIGAGAFDISYNPEGFTVICLDNTPPEVGENTFHVGGYPAYYLYIPPCADYSNTVWSDYFGSNIYGFVPFEEDDLSGDYDKDFDGTVAVPGFNGKELTPADGVIMTFTKLEFSDPNVEKDDEGGTASKTLYAFYDIKYAANESCSSTDTKIKLKNVTAKITPHEITQAEIESIIKSRRTPITDDYYAYAKEGCYDGSNNGKLDGNSTTNVILFPEDPAKTAKFRLNAYYVDDESSTTIVASANDAKYIHVETNTDGFWNNTDYETYNYAFPAAYNNFEGAIGNFQPYVERSANETTLTFKYDILPTDANITYYTFPDADNAVPDWDKAGNKTNITKVVFDPYFKDAAPTSCLYWFNGFEGLTTIQDIQYLNTADVTRMDGMFASCKALQAVDVSHFDTKKVINMKEMFASCGLLETIDVSHFNTENVTNMESMFSGCSNVKVLDVSGFDTRNVTNMTYMFQNCSVLTTLDVSHFNTSKVTSMSSMFYNCGYSTLNPLDVSGFDTQNVTTMAFMFNNCNQSALDVSHFDTKKVTNMSYMFSFYKGTSLDVSNFTTTSVTDMSFMFNNSPNLTSLDLSSFQTDNVENMQSMFSYGLAGGSSSLTSLNLGDNFNTEKVTNMSYMFNGLSQLENLDLGDKFNTALVTDMSYMFMKCKKLTSLDLSKFNTGAVTSMMNMFNTCTNLKTIYVTEGLWTTSNIQAGTFTDDTKLVGGEGTTYSSSKTTSEYARIDGGPESSTPGYLTAAKEAYAVYADGTLTFKCGDKTSESSSYVYDLPTTINDVDDVQWLERKNYITKVVFDESFDFARPVTCAYWFSGCTKLTEITGMEYLHTDKVTDMSYMFNNCESLELVDVSQFNTANVTTMQRMFGGCYKMRMLNLTSFNTAKVTEMEGMFSMYINSWPKTNLTAIYVGAGWDLTKVTSSNNMFDDCAALIGGKGTTFNSSYEDISRAKVDGGTSDPGYLTDISNHGYAELKDGTLTFKQGMMPAKTDGVEYFELTSYTQNGLIQTGENVLPGWCSKRKDITKVVFEPEFYNVIVRDCGYWFYECTNLTSIEYLTNFNTSEVTTMKFMFADCSQLASIDLSNFHTNNVYNFASMFSGCTALTKLDDIANITFNTTKYKNTGTGSVGDERIKVDGMFAHSGLKKIDVSHWATTPIGSYRSLFLHCDQLTDVNVTGIVKAYTVDPETGNDVVATTDLYNMFFGCSSLGTDLDHPLDVSSFETDNVTNMAYMFNDCSGLESIDVSNFDTKNVKNMSYMFAGCKKLKVLDISKFNTSSATNMTFMFADCYDLTTIKVGSGWSTANVDVSDRKGENLFRDDYSLIGNFGAMVDVSVYNTDNNPYTYINDIDHANCTKPDGYLTTGDYKIFYDLDKDDDELVLETIDDAPAYFADGAGVASLPELEERAEGDAFKGWHILTHKSKYEIDFATAKSSSIASTDQGNRIYAAEWTFTKEKYVVYDGETKTLTFHFDSSRPESGTYDFNDGTTVPKWVEKELDVEKVVIADPIRPTSCCQWFKGLSKLTVLDLRNLKTNNLINTESMFEGCSSLTAILVDNSQWSTSNVNITKSANMFKDCSSLIGEGGSWVEYIDKSYAYAKVDEDNYVYYGYFTADKYKIFYDLNNGELNGESNPAPAEYLNSAIDLPSSSELTPPDSDYEFGGWLRQIENGKYDNEGPSTSVVVRAGSGNMWYKATWNPYFRVTYTYNGDEYSDDYTTLKDALTASPTVDAGTAINVTLCRDYFDADETFICTDDKTYIVNLADYEMTGSYDIDLKNGRTSITINGDDEKTDIEANFSVGLNSSLTINGGKYTSYTADDAVIYHSGKVTIEAGVLTGTVYCALSGDGDAVINGGTFIGSPSAIINKSGDYGNPDSYISTDCYIKDNISKDVYAEEYLDSELAGTDMEGNTTPLTNITVLKKHKFNVVLPSYFTSSSSGYYGESDIYTFGITPGSNHVVAGDVLLQYLKSVTTDSDGNPTAYEYSTVKAYPKTNTNLYEFKIPDGLVPDPHVPTADQGTYDGIITVVEPYAVITDEPDPDDATKTIKTLTFRYDGSRGDYATGIYDITSSHPWSSAAASVDAVVIDESFKDYKPTTCEFWFCGFEKITSLDLSNLNTSAVTNMEYMFDGCKKLETITIGNDFSTSSVTSMWRMFNDCESLTSESLNAILTTPKKDSEGRIVKDEEGNTVYLFDTKKVKDMYFLFANCQSLTTIDVSHLNTSSATKLTSMFQDCSALGSGTGNENYVLDISNFSTAAIDDDDESGRYGLVGMFSGCTNLKNINFGETFASEGSFFSLADMFSGCEKLEKVDLSHFKMDKVVDISNMFAECKTLKIVDLSCFGTTTKDFDNVDGIFNSCESLTTVLVKAGWTFSGGSSSVYSVKECFNLIGEKGTMTPKSDNADNAKYFKKEYLRIDDPDAEKPGYLSTKIVICYDLDDGEWPDGAVHPEELTGSETDDITIDNPTKTGYTFVGWTGTDLSEKSTSVTIDKDDTYNHKFTANWEQNFYTITLPTGVTIDADKSTEPTNSKYPYDGTIKLDVTSGVYSYTYTDVNDNSVTVAIPTTGTGAYTFTVPAAKAGTDITVDTPVFTIDDDETDVHNAYNTLSEALTAAVGKGYTIVQHKDYTVPTTDNIIDPKESTMQIFDLTLNVGTYTLNLGEQYLNIYGANGDVTIKGATAGNKTGTITSSKNMYTINSQYNQTHLDNVVVKNTVGSVILGSGSIYLGSGTSIVSPDATQTIYGAGKVYVESGFEAIYTDNEGNLTPIPYKNGVGYGGEVDVRNVRGTVTVQEAKYFQAKFKYSTDGTEIVKTFPNFREAITEDNYKDADGNYPPSVAISMLKDFDKQSASFFKPYGTSPIVINNIDFDINFDKALIDTCMIKVNGKTLSITGQDQSSTKAYYQFTVGRDATLNLNKGLYEFFTEVIKVEANAEVELTDVYVQLSKFYETNASVTTNENNPYNVLSSDKTAFVENSGGTLTINSGIFQYGRYFDKELGYGLYVTGGTTTINNGTFRRSNTVEGNFGALYPAYLAGGTTTIENGTFGTSATLQSKYGLYVTSAGKAVLKGGTFYGSDAAIYNAGTDILTDGYAFYTSDGTNTMLYYTGTNGGYVFEKYDENSKLLLTKDGSTDPIKSVTVKAIVPVANPSKFELGKGAKYAFDIIGGAANTTYTFTSATEDVSDGETTTNKTLVKVTYASGKYYVQTTDDAKVDETYTLTTSDPNVKIEVTMKDFAAGLFDNDWHNGPFTVATGDYKLYEFLDLSEYTKEGSAYKFSDDGDHTVWFKKTDANGIIQQTEHHVKIDQSEPYNIRVTYPDVDDDDDDEDEVITCGTSDKHTAITLPTNTVVSISAIDVNSGVKSFWISEKKTITTGITVDETSGIIYTTTQTLSSADTYSWTIKATDYAVADGNTTKDDDVCYIDITAKTPVTLTATIADWNYGATASTPVVKADDGTTETIVPATEYTATYKDARGNIVKDEEGNPVTAPTAAGNYTLTVTLNATSDMMADPSSPTSFDILAEITFDKNGHGTLSETDATTYVAVGGKIPSTSVPNLSADGYTLDGWTYTVDEGSEAWVFATNTVSDNMTLKAAWTPNSYTVQFNSDAADATGTMEPQAFTYDVTKELTANSFKRAGYSFAGWATSSKGSKVYGEEEPVSNLTTTAGGEVTLYAVWTANSYLVTLPNNMKFVGENLPSDNKFTFNTPVNFRFKTNKEIKEEANDGNDDGNDDENGENGGTGAADETPVDDGFLTKVIKSDGTAINVASGIYTLTVPSADVTVHNYMVTEITESIEFGEDPDYNVYFDGDMCFNKAEGYLFGLLFTPVWTKKGETTPLQYDDYKLLGDYTLTVTYTYDTENEKTISIAQDVTREKASKTLTLGKNALFHEPLLYDVNGYSVSANTVNAKGTIATGKVYGNNDGDNAITTDDKVKDGEKYLMTLNDENGNAVAEITINIVDYSAGVFPKNWTNTSVVVSDTRGDIVVDIKDNDEYLEAEDHKYTISGDGIHNIIYEVGTEGQLYSLTEHEVKIDGTAPSAPSFKYGTETVSCTNSTSVDGIIMDAGTEITLIASDATSGVKEIYCDANNTFSSLTKAENSNDYSATWTAVAGSYTWAMKATDNADKESSTCTVKFSVRTSVTLAVVVEDSYTYGSTITPSCTSTGLADADKNRVTYQYSTSATTGFSDEKPTNVGTYYVKAVLATDDDYSAAESEAKQFVITKKSITAIVAAFSKDYDGNTTLPSGITATLEEGGVLTADAGKVSVSIVTTSNDYPYAYPNSKVATYTIPLLLKLSGDKSGNYELSNTITTDGGVVANAINVTGKIEKVTPTLHVEAHKYAYVPDGEWSAPESFGAFINDGSTAVEGSWTLLAKNESDEYAAISAPTASGSYKAKFTPTDAANINENTSGEFTITFEKANAAITAAPTAKTGLVYSGSAQQLINAGTTTGGTMKYALSLNGTFDADITKVIGVDAKSYYVYYMVEGDDNYNGVAASETNKVEVTISPLSITDNDDLDFTVNVPAAGLTYNGTAQKPDVTVRYKGTELALTTDYAVGYDNNINATTDDNLATATISSVQNGNYDFGRGITRTFSIGKAPLKITPDAGQTKKYGEVDPTLTYTSEPATLYATNDEITGKLTREAGENFGEYEIKQGTLSAGDNYEITVATGVKFKITKADAPTITDEQKPTANRLSYGTLDAPEGKNLVYNRSAQQLVVAPAGTLPTGYTIKYAIKVEGSTAAFATTIPTATNAGTYTVLYMYDGGNNYEDISGNAYQIAVTIDKADITNVTAPEAITNLVYNGNDQALVTAGSTSVGTMKYSVDGNDYQATIPTGNAAGEYTVKYMVAGNVNYNNYTPNVVIPVKIKGVYTIKFFDYDGTTLLGETTAVEGKTPEYPGTSKPTRPADKTYTYEFSGWNPKLYEANGNQDYKAQYSTTTNCFSVKANKDEFVYNDADQKPTLVVYTKPGDEEFTLIGDGAAAEYKVVWPQDVKNFGSKTVTVSGLGAFATCDAQVYTWTIAKAKYLEEPNVVAEAETVKNKADGKIIGVSSAMEYRKDGVANYTAIDEDATEISPLAPGKYYVRYKEDGNHLASDDKMVEVGASTKLLTVTFNSNGGSVVSSVSTEYGKSITAPTAPTKTGHNFDAWYTDNQFATKWNFATNLVKDNITLYANWNVLQYTVKFVFGNGVDDLVIKKDFGTDISALKPSDPVWRGHKFTGWNKEIPITIPAEDVTITAQWEDETMQYVKFVTKWDDNTLTTYESFGAYPGESIEVTAPNDPERTGYLFQGWVTEDGQTATIPTVMPDNGMIIYADWKINQYTITFDTDGGTAIADIKQDYNTAITAPAAPSKTGYTFDYWTVDGVQTAIPATMPAKNITFKAKWKINTYKIVFHLDNGDPDVVVEAEYGAPVTAPANFSKGNHTFDCWSRTVPATMPASEEPLEITALWIEDGKYVVKLLTENDLNEEVVVWSSQSYYEDEAIDYTSYADPTRDGYTFQGWATADGQATTMPAKMPEGGATLYAKWGVKQYTITYNTNGGSAINETNTLKRDYNSAIPKPSDPSKTGNTFKGWFADSDCTTPCDFTNGKVTGDITLYAKWEVNTYTITFNSNGGSHVDPITQDYNSAIDAPANPSREGFEFMRWNPELPATMPAGGLDVTAVWQEAEPPVVNIVTINGIQVYPRDPEKPEVVVECIGSGEVKIEATDNSNVQPKVEYTVNGGESKLYEGPFTLDTHGEVAIKIVATDNVGNEADPIVVKAVVRREAALAAGSYTYTQLSGKDVVLEGFDLDGADIYSIVIDEKDEYKDLFVAETNSLDDQILNNVAVGKHTLHFYTSLNGNKHDTGIKDVELTVFGYPVMAEQLNINANGYCEDENADITLEFKNIDRPVWYKIKDVHDSYQEFKGVDKLAKDVGIMNFLVNGLPDGNLTLKVTFTDDPDKNTESDTVTFNIKVNLPSGTIVQLFDDLIAIDNHDDLYTAFQWYKDGVLIEGADQQYYQVEGKLYGKYSAFVTISNGDKLKVCSADFGKKISKSLKRSVNAYPNPARANEEITLELLNFDDAEYEECVIKIVNAQGAAVATIDNCSRINTVSLPSGTYTGYVIRSGSNGDRVSFKLIVK